MSVTDSAAENAPPTESTPPAAPPARARPGWRAAILRLHFYAGLLVGPFLLIAAISGGLYAAAPTVEKFVYADQLKTRTDGPARPLAEQVAAAQAARPGLQVTAVRTGDGPGLTTRVLFDDPALTADGRQLAVYVDPASAQVQGALPVYGSVEALPIRFWIDRLHVDLHLGDVGRFYSELAASWLWVVALGGFYLWWRHRRGNLRRMLAYDRKAKGRGGRMSRHAAVGTWLLLGLLFFSATGLTWSKYAGENIGQLRAELGWTKPALSTSLTPGGEHGGGGEHADHQMPVAAPAVAPEVAEQTRARNIAVLDRAVTEAAARGVDGAVQVSIPKDPNVAITVAQTRQPWRMGIDSATVDPNTGQVITVLAFASWPLLAKATELLINTHMGWQFGLLNQIVLVAFAALLATVIVRGYLMWWQRRPKRGGLPKPPARGAIRKVEPSHAIPAILGIAFLGWFLPVFGVSLLAFVVLDLAIGVAKRGRANLRNSP
ncbi:PepSY-associated TM helix domain-containing protein [Tsukamurella ocularis]|uniref:PepSY-associated TM helix domain-containing protein n=1 Tax=Tsukamurella ocularis TaxID=1970234 RepID=UPI002168777D|nr:PepSY domain-containing protein [Tsukamurella ocularis]MCS3779039.1 putative iron-regulated membrane protein [Tsukamurella ocularis]MCS3787341.1 putative iron-regulated membrane protein [Tsukamurella ocularis]MCS3851722.1 putative iron-regulated membrane protein [Tsukamurella ocularis]